MTIDKINKINDYLTLVLRAAALNALWSVTVVLSLGLLFGPATYAMQKYYDATLRQKKEVPLVKTFFKTLKQNFKQSFLTGLFFITAFGVIITNLFIQTVWFIQVGNILMLLVTLILFTHSFTLMSAIGYRKLFDLLKASFILGCAYLHFTIIAWSTIVIFYVLTSSLLPAGIFLFGIGGTGLILSLASRQVLNQLKKLTQADE